MANLLDELAIQYGTDKSSKHHNYTAWYFILFNSIRLQPLKLVELGVFQAASLKMWADFFPNAQLYGVDNKPEAAQYETERTKIFIGNQRDRRFLKKTAELIGSPDIIIDDGGHRPEEQLDSLFALFPHLKDGGIYVIEDLQCSYLRRSYGFRAGLRNPFNTVEYLRRLLDVMHGEAGHGGLIGDEVSSRVQAVHFYPRIAFLFKGNPSPRLPGYKGKDLRRPG